MTWSSTLEIEVGLRAGFHSGQGACTEDGQSRVADDGALVEDVAHAVNVRLGPLTSRGQGGMALESVEASSDDRRSRHDVRCESLHRTFILPRRRTSDPAGRCEDGRKRRKTSCVKTWSAAPPRRQVLSRRSAEAKPSTWSTPGYGTEPGVKAYSHVSDRFSPFATQTIPATVHEAPYILDGLLMNETGRRGREQYADTGGFTDHVFAACSILGYAFVPHIRDLPLEKRRPPPRGRPCTEQGPINSASVNFAARVLELVWPAPGSGRRDWPGASAPGCGNPA